MIQIYDDETLSAALGGSADAELALLVKSIADGSRASDLWALTCILIVEPCDSGSELEGALGFDPLTGPLHEPGEPFVPYWSWLGRRGDWHQMLVTAGDSGFAWFLLVPDRGADRSGLAALCRAHAAKPET